MVSQEEQDRSDLEAHEAATGPREYDKIQDKADLEAHEAATGPEAYAKLLAENGDAAAEDNPE